jgi:hypothetical protein
MHCDQPVSCLIKREKSAQRNAGTGWKTAERKSRSAEIKQDRDSVLLS